MSLVIAAKVDDTELLLRMRNGQKRLAYAVVNAINNTAKRIQQAEFGNIREKFLVRKAPFFFGTPDRPGGVAARIRPFASVSQGRPFAEVFVAQASTISSQRRLLLSVFEKGGTKEHTQGAASVAVPITGSPARPSMKDPVVPEFTFARMGLKAYRGNRKLTREVRGKKGKVRKVGIGLFGEFGRLGLPGQGAGVQWRGTNRTFLLTRTENLPLGGVFQRTGPKRADISLRWKFQRSVTVDDRLAYLAVARATSDLWFKEEMEKEVIRAIQFNKGRTAA